MLDGVILKEEKSDTLHVLPIYYPPPIITYLMFPFQLSIILANKNSIPWFYSNYIQIFSKLDANSIFLFHYYPDLYSVENTNYFIDMININETILPITKKSIISKICRWIDNNLYVLVFLSESELPGTALFGRGLYPHPQFLFGYDLSQQTLKLLNYNDKHKFAIIDIKFDDFINAMFSKDSAKAITLRNSWHGLESNHPILLYRYRVKDIVSYELDIEKILESIEDYLNSRDYVMDIKLTNPRYSEYQNSKWGVSVYGNLIKYLDGLKYEQIDHRAFYGIWEHKRIMTARLEYLEELNYLNPSEGYSKKYMEVEKEAKKIRMLAMKCMYSKNPIIKKNKIISYLENISQKDIDILKDVCDSLRKSKQQITEHQ